MGNVCLHNGLGSGAIIVCVGALLACKGLSGSESEAKPQASVAAPAAPAPITEIAFSTVVPKAGTKTAAVRKSATKFTMDGKVYRETSALDAGLEVQDSDEFRVTKAAIDVKDLQTTKQQGSGDEKKTVSPLSGSRYIITRSDDGKLTALDSAGAKVAASQLKLLKDEFAGVFEKNHTGAFLPERPVKIGEKLSPPSDAVLKMLEIKDDGKTTMDGIEFILASGTPERASFDVTMTMTQKIGGGLRLRAKLKGKIEIKPTGNWLLGVDLKGPLELLDASGNQKGTGDITASLTQTTT
jgi:hypothetical protein